MGEMSFRSGFNTCSLCAIFIPDVLFRCFDKTLCPLPCPVCSAVSLRLRQLVYAFVEPVAFDVEH